MRRRSNFVLILAFNLAFASMVLGQSAPESATDERDRSVMNRFLAVVEKAPRRGTALDRVYGYHVERGSLDAFLKSYQDRTAADPNDGVAWLILGLIESQRGRDAAAVAALRKAETARPDDAMPCYYLGQSLVLVGQPDDAAQAFERAIARKPNRADLLEIFQALGRVYQRAHRNEQALAIWSRLEKLFPDDPRVQEQIAASLAEESQPDQALPRYEALAKATKDRFRQVQFQVDAAELKVRLNRTADALADFEGLLGRLDPESWLYREVRRKIEEIFTKTDDLAGLAAYYEKWIKKSPDDVEAMSRLGKALASQGRLAEARGWYEKAVGLAPTRRDLRSALIEQLLIEKKFAEAAAQYEAIAKSDPNNPDVLREWGRILLRDLGKPEVERKKAASAVWRKLTDARPDDPSTMVAVADLFRSAELNDEAIVLYKSAVAKSPTAPQYAEYLGEFYHRLKRSQEAVATWSKMAEAPNRTTKTLNRLSEVLSGFGYRAEALAAATEAAALDRDDFDLQLRLADMFQASDKLDDEAKQLDLAAKAATGEEQREGVLDRQIKNAQMSGRLPARIIAMKAELSSRTDASSEAWRVLARYLETDQKSGEALTMARKSLAVDPKSIPSLVMVARLDEATGNLSAAADTLRKLAEVDRRARTEYLTGVARLEARLGRKDAALKAGRDLLAAAPGQLDNHQFFAELCFQLGQVDEGLDALRRAVRLNEADPKALLGLAETLATQFRTEEAIEMFWRAFDKSPDLEAKLSVINRLTALYLQRNQFDRLIARLERQGREADRQREMTICLAQAYSASGDFGTARAELERLLSANPRDTKLLYQLSMLAESEGDPATASKFQKQLVDLAPGDEANARLAQLFLQGGEIAEAEALWTRLTANGEPESYRVLMAVDSLLGSGKKEAVVGITENLLRKRPDNWEAIYREGQALAGLNRPQEAAGWFRSILALKGNSDDLGAVAKAKKRGLNRPTDPNALAAAPAHYSAPVKSFPLQDRLTRVTQIRTASGIEGRYSTGPIWSPDDLGQAKMASLAWLTKLATKSGTQEAFFTEIRQAAEKAPSDPQAQWNHYYLQVIREEFAETFEAAKGLARASSSDPAALFALLNILPARDKTTQNRVINSGTTGPDMTPALTAPDLDLIFSSYQTLKARQPDWVHAAILTAVADELKRAKRDDALEQFYRAAVEGPADPDSAASILRVAAERGDVENVIKLHDRYERLVGSKPIASTNLYVYFGGYYSLSSSPSDSFCRAMLARFDAKAPADVTRLLDHYLIAARRPERITRRVRALASGGPNRTNNRYQIWSSKSVKFSSVTYPLPNPYYDLAGIQVLRNAYELFKRDDLLSDLTSHYKKSLEAGTDVDRAYTHLALCYLNWWNDEKDEALLELTEAAKAAKSDPELLLALAELRAQRNEPEEALRVADSFEPLDQKAMQRREVLAIRLAVMTGDVARARKAAERLFGLRLDADTQVQLASQMHQLGMHELAEAVLGRARRRAGGNLTALVSLMLQYQRQGKPEIAVQVANQVLRRNPARANPGYYDEGAEARTEAVQVLARSGKIKEIIGRLEDQVKRTPGSLQLHQRLADYHLAAGDKDKAKLEYDAIAGLRPEDAKIRFQVASDLSQAGEFAAAVEHYKVALRLEPSLLGSGFYQIQESFQQAGKFDDLVILIEQADVRSMGSIYYVARIIRTVLQDKAKRERGLALFAKAWKAFPGQHESLFSYISDEGIWQLPEIYDYLREAAIPAESKKFALPWMGFNEELQAINNGRVTTIGGRLVDVAERRGKLESIASEIERAEQRIPTWRGGKALKGMVLARQGRFEEAKALLTPLADTKQVDFAPVSVRLAIGQEWESVPALQGLALTFYEGALKENDSKDVYYVNSPSRRLVEMYRSVGRLDDARKELLSFAKTSPDWIGNPNGTAYWKIQDRSEIGSKLIAIGFPADAARLFDETISDTDSLELARDWGSDDDTQLNLLKTGLDLALEALDHNGLAATFKAQLASPGPIDLLLLVQPRELESASVASLLQAAIRSLTKAAGDSDEIRASLTRRCEAQPTDIPNRIALTLATLEGGTPDAIQAEVAKLAKLVEQMPLEPLETSQRANSRQRLEAARQLGLWLVARECKTRPELRATANALADRATEAARRMADPSWSLAMLREAAQDALDRGDRIEAEAYWSRMLDSILPKPKSSPVQGVTDKLAGVPVATLDRFEQAIRLAKLASARGMLAFSLRAALEPLRGGPPVVPITIRSNNGGVSRNPAERAKQQAVDRAVEGRLSELEATWEAAHASPLEEYQLLREVVLPEGRPTEIFSYPRPFGEASTESPRSVASSLVRWAIRAARVEDLRTRVEARLKQSTAEVPARSILVHLDLAQRDFAGASQGLQTLAALLAKDKLQSSAEIAAFAALPALAIAETESAARLVLDATTASFVLSGAEEATVKVQLAQARRHFNSHRAEEGRKQVQAALESLERATASGQVAYRNYGNSFQTRRENLQVVAAEYARASRWDEVLEALGQSADTPFSPIQGVTAGPPFALVAVARHLGSLPALERYEKLRAWTMPNEQRAAIRSLAAFASVNVPPEAFGRFSVIGDGSGVVATLEMLVLAAKDAGKLDDLAREVREASEKKREGAETLLSLVEVARGRGAEIEPALKALLADWSKKSDDPGPTIFGNNPIKPTPWPDFLRVRAALADPKLAGLGRKLVEKSKRKLEDFNIQGHLRQSVVSSLLTSDESRDPGLSWWEPWGRETASTSQLGLAPGRWMAQGGHIVHRGGTADEGSVSQARNETLVFRVPLAGKFSFRIDASGRGAQIGYGGLMMTPASVGRQATSNYGRNTTPQAGSLIRPIGSVESIARPILNSPTAETVQLTVEVEPGLVRYFVDGHLCFTDRDPNPSSPWLVLGSPGDSDVDFRNLVITGEPSILREVSLVRADRLDGWLSDFFAETRPRRNLGPEGRPKTSPLGTLPAFQGETNWAAVDGTIFGGRIPNPGGDAPAQSQLAYHRPLRPGESIACEFFHEPDAVTVHPALGRLAFLLEPNGVRLHWLTDGADLDVSGLPASNAVDEPSSRRGPALLPLKPGDWNTLKVALVGRVVEIELNGVKIFERDLEPNNDRVFSFYHDKARSRSQIRNVVLKGDWPGTIPVAHLSSRRDAGNIKHRKARTSAIGEAVFARDSASVLAGTRTFPPAERYEALLAWVVPGDDHTDFRLAGNFTPTDPATSSSPSPFPPGLTRVEVGGTFEAPALALIEAARAVNKLDELAGRIDQAAASTDLDRRGQLALRALTLTGLGREEQAKVPLAALKPMLEALDAEAPELERWPEFVAIAELLGRPALKESLKPLADLSVSRVLHKEPKVVGETWSHHAVQLAAVLTLPDPSIPLFAPDLGGKAWARVTHSSARSRGTGAPLPLWSLKEGTLTHRPGHDRDYVYFRTPLRGNFEVTAEVISGRPLQLAYGGIAIGVSPDGKEVVITTVGSSAKKVALDPPLAAVEGPRKLRLKVESKTLAAFIDDRKLFEQGLPASPDPWLALAMPSDESGSHRDVRIQGDPVVPDQLDLSDQPDLLGWIAGEVEGPSTDLDPAWRKRSDEIVGRLLKDAVGTKQENWIRYHRPMVEDGEIRYEFFHEPGKATVAPALDRLAFLVEPDGIMLHRITDAPFDRSGLAPGNSQSDPEGHRGLAALPIKPGAWNKMSVAVLGDKVTLTLNDVIIHEHSIEPTNQRTFGLFHFADEVEARVKNVTYRGEWPKARPLDLGFEK